ncbi:MAG TPA: outer membrane lipoprotein carrier protein LolA [Rhodopila sp.]
MNHTKVGSFSRGIARAVILPVLGLLAACATTLRPQMSAADAADVGRVSAYLNSIPRFEAHFVQYGALGPDSGQVWMDRPAGHMRIDYADRDGRVMVVNGGQVLIVDRGTGETTTMPVARTPLSMLLTARIDLSGPVTVTNLARQPGMIQMTLEKTDAPAQGSLTLTLADQPLRLVAVTMTDVHQRTSTMRLSDVDTAPALTPSMFHPPALPPES